MQKEIYVQTANAAYVYYDVTGGQLEFNTSTGTIIGYTGSPTDVCIPSTIEGIGVTAIGKCSFESCTSLTSISMPESVSAIGMSAFRNCTNLTSLNLSEGLQHLYYQSS